MSRRPLGAVLGQYWALLGHPQSHLVSSYVIFSHLGAHLGLSKALSGQSWAISGAPPTGENHP
eukprot:6854141-Pyramimonas_sp.AAC.1